MQFPLQIITDIIHLLYTDKPSIKSVVWYIVTVAVGLKVGLNKHIYWRFAEAHPIKSYKKHEL